MSRVAAARTPYAPIKCVLSTKLKIDLNVVEFKALVQGQGQTLPRPTTLAHLIPGSRHDRTESRSRISNDATKTTPGQTVIRERIPRNTRARPIRERGVPEGHKGFTFIARVALGARRATLLSVYRSVSSVSTFSFVLLFFLRH